MARISPCTGSTLRDELESADFQPTPPHDSSTRSIDAASASLEYRGAAARAATASRWRSTGLPASLAIAAAIATGFSGGTQTPHSRVRTMPVASPSGNDIRIGMPIPMHSKILDGMTVLKSGASRSGISDWVPLLLAFPSRVNLPR